MSQDTAPEVKLKVIATEDALAQDTRTVQETSLDSSSRMSGTSSDHGLSANVWTWIRKDTKSTDWFIVLLTAVIAGTSYFQWKEIHSGSSDTHTLAVAADTQAKKMADMSAAADKIREAAQGMVAQEQRMADEAEKSLKENLAQGK